MKNKSLMLKVIQEVDENINAKINIALKYGISKSTLSTILKNRNKITAADKDKLELKRRNIQYMYICFT